MGLLPEFFTLLGIDIFLAMSLLTALLDQNIPKPAKWLYQGAAAAGLGQLFLSQQLINSGIFSRTPTDTTRFWVSAIYLLAAVASVIGLNLYLAIIRKNMDLAAALSGTVTVPVSVVSALLVFSFPGSGGEVSLTPATFVILAVSILVSSLSGYKLIQEASRHISPASRLDLPHVSAAPTPQETPSPVMETQDVAQDLVQDVPQYAASPLDMTSLLKDWDESPEKKEVEE